MGNTHTCRDFYIIVFLIPWMHIVMEGIRGDLYAQQWFCHVLCDNDDVCTKGKYVVNVFTITV